VSRSDTLTDPRRRDLLRLAAGGALVAVAARAQPRGELRIVLAAETAQHTALVQALRARWPAVTTFRDPAPDATGRPKPLAYAAIGPLALQHALRTPLDAPLIAVLVSRQAYAQLVDQGARPPRGVTAIFAESSPVQQMRTIGAVMRRPVTVGALSSARSRYLEPLLETAAQGAGLSAIVQVYDPAIGVSRNLLRLAAADAVLIFPDSDIFSPDSLRELLESTYRRRQPVFGFSEALVNAGTLASAYSSADDLAAHLIELLGTVAESRLPAPDYPRYWRVAINDSVARSLDIVIDSSARSLGDRP
jgi:putative tryptophan/tyrosine transport system substrate-binding protein